MELMGGVPVQKNRKSFEQRREGWERSLADNLMGKDRAPVARQISLRPAVESVLFYT